MTEKTTTIKSRAGYDILVRYILDGDEEIVVVMAHGFGSSKASPTVTLLMKNLPPNDGESELPNGESEPPIEIDNLPQSETGIHTRQRIGVVAFDFPAHGESPVDGTYLCIENCINDLASAVDFAKAAAPAARIINFGSSFGAYITLLYITRLNLGGTDASGLAEDNRFDSDVATVTTAIDAASAASLAQPHNLKAFLRSAAVNMPELFTEPTPEDAELLARDGYVIKEYDPRNLKITNEFIADLQANNLFKCFARGDAQLKMIHGTSDRDIDYAKAVAFATQYNIELITVPGGDHSLSIPGAPEKVVEEVRKFIGRG